jgi:hypothetical protein
MEFRGCVRKLDGGASLRMEEATSVDGVHGGKWVTGVYLTPSGKYADAFSWGCISGESLESSRAILEEMLEREPSFVMVCEFCKDVLSAFATGQAFALKPRDIRQWIAEYEERMERFRQRNIG